jgi:magnesium transporter
MPESLSTVSEKTGLPPGSLVHVGEVLDAESRISVLTYNQNHIDEHVVESIDDILRYRDTESITWVNFEGLVNTSFVEAIGEHFKIHPLVLEDILNTHQRTKFEEYDKYLFLVFKGMYVNEDRAFVRYEQISILIFDNFIFTFKERRDRIRLKKRKGRVRALGSDYLAYAILDSIVDLYFSLQDFVEENIETIEEDLLSGPDSETLSAIMNIRREMLMIRKSAAPLRELLGDLIRSESPLIKHDTLIYYRDVYDHVLRLIESIETNRDMITGLLDIYHSSISNKMNEVMKVLTIFASIFIPLTFITGIYGMNFKFMPELEWKWSYPLIWTVFIAIPVGLLAFFKKKKWI